MTQKWIRSHSTVRQSRDQNLTQYYFATGYKTDWKIEKRTDCCKPYVLAKICTDARYGAFDKLKSAKAVAFFHDFG